MGRIPSSTGLSGRPRRRFRSVRARATAAACGVLGLFLALAVVGFTVQLRRSLVRSVDQTAKAQAESLAALAAAGTMPRIVVSPGHEDTLIQILDWDGTVVATSANLEGRPPVAQFPAPEGRARIRTVGPLALEGHETYRVAALQTQGPNGALRVYVGRTLEHVNRNVVIVAEFLGFGSPLLVVVVGIITWAVAGRALRPVEAIRAEVADITMRGLHRRIPEPTTDDEVARLAETMNAMLSRLEEANERQVRFLGDASHELKSPLASARLALEFPLAHPARADWRQAAADVLDDIEQMERLVHNLLFLARFDEERFARPGRPLDLDDLVMQEGHRIRNRARVKVDLSRVVPVPMEGDPEALRRVIRNLLENAERYAHSAIGVELRPTGGQAELVIQDDGPGIPPEERERIFERFTRLDKTRSRHSGGTGLGLAIARDIVRGHHGTIAVADSPLGARLVVKLPTLDSPDYTEPEEAHT